MSTSFQLIYDVFFERVKLFLSPNVTINDIFPDTRLEQLLKQAIGDYSLELEDLNVVYSTFDENDNVVELGYFEDDLNQKQINLLGLLMYRHYLLSERDKYSRLAKYVGRDFNIQYGDVVNSLKENYDTNEDLIHSVIEKLKRWGFET